VQLQRQVAATSTYIQFDFRYIKQLDAAKSEQAGGAGSTSRFNSIWDKL
jgi:hypothetical protein